MKCFTCGCRGGKLISALIQHKPPHISVPQTTNHITENVTDKEASAPLMTVSPLKSRVLFSIRPPLAGSGLPDCSTGSELRAVLLVLGSSGGCNEFHTIHHKGCGGPGNFALRAHTGRRWRSKTFRYAEAWKMSWGRESFMRKQLHKEPHKVNIKYMIGKRMKGVRNLKWRQGNWIQLEI